MCDTYNRDGTPHITNTRWKAKEIFDQDLKQEPWYGIEQEYFITKPDQPDIPLGFPGGPLTHLPEGKEPRPQGPYYCSAGYRNAIGRDVVEAHYKACLFAGIKISGVNAEVAPSQWEYQVGPSVGIKAADSTCMSRYIMIRIAEMFGVNINFHPKLVKGDWNGSGCHTNFSTKAMREDGGYKEIVKAIAKLSLKHKEHIEAYGADNDLRLSGRHETAGIDNFSYGVASRAASIRIPTDTEKDGKGYFEDRRPASNMDPYLVTSLIFKTSCL
jgi:glutamine synthetase